ncbi:alpha-1,4-N-acetylglucosaminyltransferase-like [Lissotriton helveticus]
MVMNTWTKALVLILMTLFCSFVYWKTVGEKKNSIGLMTYLQDIASPTVASTTAPLTTLDTPKEPGIFFIETTDRMFPPALVVCSIESAARTYPDRPVYFLMKGLTKNIPITLKSNYTELFLLASLKNVHILPLSFEELFKDTPLYSWYHQVDPSLQRFWIHHVSDACREALLWKYGGIYMDTDVISLKPIQIEDFLVAESFSLCSSAVLGFRQNHPFIWDCMKDYVKNYDGNSWGQQGPLLFTRMAAKLCNMPDFARSGDGMCQNFSYLQPKRFYPIPYTEWRRYYGKWENADNMFDMSYGLHFWNYMNQDHMEVTAGSNTVAEHIFKNYCPLTYHSLLKTKPG